MFGPDSAHARHVLNPGLDVLADRRDVSFYLACGLDERDRDLAVEVDLLQRRPEELAGHGQHHDVGVRHGTSQVRRRLDVRRERVRSSGR